MKRLRDAILLLATVSLALTLALRGEEIHDAARAGDLAKVAALAEKDPGSIGGKDSAGRTPLHWACRGVHLEVVRFLVERGADVNAADRSGLTPLHSLASRGHLEAARLLIEKGARVDAATPGGWTPLHMAANGGQADMAVLLAEKGAAFHTRNDAEDTPFLAAAWGGHWDVADRLLARLPSGRAAILSLPDFDGNTLLHLACRAGKREFAERLLAAGIDLNHRNALGESAYNLAESQGHAGLAGFLAEKGADRGPARFPKLEGPYLGQTPPGTMPKLFAKGIVSTRQGMYGTITFSPDGDEAFWKPNGPNMLSMRKVGGLWTPPQAFPNPDGDSINVPFFSVDGRRLYVMRGKLDPSGMEKDETIWFMEKTPAGWSELRPFDPAVNSGPMHWQFAMDRTGDVYLSRSNIFRAAFENGAYRMPERLPAPINETYAEKDRFRAGDIDPFISPGGDYLIFMKFQAGALFVSFKTRDGDWSEPQNLSQRLGAEIDKGAKVTPDGKYLFFQSGRRGSGGLRGLYWVDAKVIESLRPKG